ncbi:tyrosine-protein phosphatase [Streptomyces sp. R41]|uniref:Tyrosine-protein phosphatase n=1 Tax=Streptomyces sp. R41 TaxID=3238632 RepID=A0AB39RKM7_9ACTN
MNRHIPFERLHNFRDLGGYRTADSRTVRPGRLFRADSLGKLPPGTPDWDRFLCTKGSHRFEPVTVVPMRRKTGSPASGE